MQINVSDRQAPKPPKPQAAVPTECSIVARTVLSVQTACSLCPQAASQAASAESRFPNPPEPHNIQTSKHRLAEAAACKVSALEIQFCIWRIISYD